MRGGRVQGKRVVCGSGEHGVPGNGGADVTRHGRVDAVIVGEYGSD